MLTGGPGTTTTQHRPSAFKELIGKVELDASCIYPAAGRDGAEVVLGILAGKKSKMEMVIDSTDITTENIQRIESIF